MNIFQILFANILTVLLFVSIELALIYFRHYSDDLVCFSDGLPANISNTAI